MSLANKALVAHMTIGIWTGVKLEPGDIAAPKRVATRLAPKKALAGVVAAMGALRTHFYATCPPWKGQGDRLLPVALFDRFMADHDELRADFDRAADDFMSNSYSAIHARDKSGELPDPAEMRAKFYVVLDLDFIPDVSTKRDDPRLEKLRSQIERNANIMALQAQCFIWERLEAMLDNYATRMLAGAIFRDTIVSNLRDLVELAPGLNLLEDPEVGSLIEHGLNHLLMFDPAELRQSAKVRGLAGLTAQTYLAQVRAKLKIMRESAQ